MTVDEMLDFAKKQLEEQIARQNRERESFRGERQRGPIEVEMLRAQERMARNNNAQHGAVDYVKGADGIWRLP